MGAIGVVRVEGYDPWSLVGGLLRSARGSTDGVSRPSPGELVYCQIIDAGEVIDDGIVSVVQSGDGWAVDIAAHGGVRVLERILQAVARRGAVIDGDAEELPSVWRASSQLESEILAALGRAKTESSVRFLAYQRTHLVSQLLSIASLCESDMKRAERELTVLADGCPSARRMIEGATVVIIGPPNAGKSSLFNRLVGREAVVVSETPGTTRDWVSAKLDWLGVPVRLIDTAGTRETLDALEAEAIGSGGAQRLRADAVIVVLDGSDDVGCTSWFAQLEREASKQPHIVAVNKSDRWANRPELLDRVNTSPAYSTVAVSAKSGNGIGSLVMQTVAALGIETMEMLRPTLFTTRQAGLARSILGFIRDEPLVAAHRIRTALIGL